MILFGKKKKRIAFLLGCLQSYIDRMEDLNSFFESSEIMSDILIELGISWYQMNEAKKEYKSVKSFQNDCLKEGS